MTERCRLLPPRCRPLRYVEYTLVHDLWCHKLTALQMADVLRYVPVGSALIEQRARKVHLRLELNDIDDRTETGEQPIRSYMFVPCSGKGV